MRRLLSLAVLGAAALLLPAHAQIRGGMHGGGIAAPRVSSGFHSGPVVMGRGFARPAPVAMGRGFARPGRVFVGRPGVAPRGMISGQRFATVTGRFTSNQRLGRGHRIFFPNCVGVPCFPGHRHHFFRNSFFFGFGNPFFGNPFFGSPFFSPFASVGFIPGFDYPYDSYNYPPQQQPVAVQNDNAAETQLAVEVQRLSDEIADLRGEQAMERIQNRPAPAPGTSMSVVPPAPSTTFVFRDGRRLTAQNYAISGQTLWILNEHAAQKFSLSDLDRAATEQVNAAAGVELHLPEAAKR